MKDRTWGAWQPIGPERRARVIQFLRDYPRMSLQAIADRVGISRRAVVTINKQNKIRPKRGKT